MANVGRRCIAFVAALLTMLTVLVTVTSEPAVASYLDQGLVVAEDPVDVTPYVLDGHVTAITTVGDRVVVGGTFTTVRNVGNPTDLTRNYIFAFDRNTGLIDTGFVPQLNAEVETLAAAPDGTSVFVGGVFSTVNGTSNFGLTKLDVATGNKVPGFNATTAGRVRDLEVSGNTLYLGGDIWSVNGVPRSRLASVNATTGAVDTSFTVGTTAPRVTVDWVAELAVHPDGSEMTIVGNFSEVDGIPRAQVAVIDLGGPTAQLADWSTEQFDATCSSSFWTYVRDVEYAPSGDYLVIATTGGPRPPTLCDTASRWEVGVRGSDLLETWADWSGGDTLTAVAISDVAVYIGGHQRWMNNHTGRDFAGPGAVEREGVAALDPINGVPLSWNPGKDRGVAVWDLHLSDLGLYVGSDTDFAAGEYHPKLVQFPLAGGSAVPVPTPADLPTDLFAGEGNVLSVEVFDGVSAGTPTTVPGNQIDWDDVGGVFHQAGRLYWMDGSGELLSRPFDGVTMGSTRTEPSWVSWGGVSAATWWDGRLYFTVSGSDELRYRYFSLDSGIVGSEEFVVSGDGDGLDWSGTRGLAAAEGKLYYTTSGGNLYSIDLAGTDPVPGTATLISGPSAGDGRDWAGTDIFMLEMDNSPAVTITAPTDGEAVAGSVGLSVDATDDIGVDRVEFAIAGTTVGIDSDGSDGWSLIWDSTAVAEGPVALQATAFDGGGQQSVDSISIVVDNLGPETTLDAPVEAAIVSGTVSLTATVTDAIGVAQAEFLVNGGSVGVDTDGTDGWSVDWDSTGTGDGAATVLVVGTDTFGRTSSDQATVTVDNQAAGVIVVVVADPGSMRGGDAEIVTRLGGLGYTVSVVDDADVTSASVAGASLVIVTSSANSFVIGTKLVDAALPVWVAKPWLLDDMGLTGTASGTDFGTLSTSSVAIVDPASPLAGGFNGTVSVTTSNVTTSFGVPGPAASIVGTAGGRPVLFAYDDGATLADGSTAAGCRLHHSIFGNAPLAFTSDGWALFDAVVAYATNDCTAPPIDNPPTVTVTAPAEGETVVGQVTITADAADDIAVTHVEFVAGGVSLGVDTDGGDGWSTVWDSTATPDGLTAVTATATDSVGQTGVDSVNVSVDNLGPAVSILSPADGSTVREVVTINADIGGDPTVTQVEFFVDGGSVRVDSDGSDGWSADWDTTTISDGAVTVSVIATDSMLRTASYEVNVNVDNAAAGLVTMVVGTAANLGSVDLAIQNRLLSSGYTVTVVDDNDVTAADAAGMSLVYVSSTVNSSVLGSTLRDVTVPVWVAKPWSLDDMLMTGTGAGTDFGTTRANTLTIVDDLHPLAAGFSGNVAVTTTDKTMSWGTPAAGASVVATANGLATSFVYPGGTQLVDGSTAAGCRLHVSAFQTALLSWNADAWAIFDAAAAFAANDCS